MASKQRTVGIIHVSGIIFPALLLIGITMKIQMTSNGTVRLDSPFVFAVQPLELPHSLDPPGFILCRLPNLFSSSNW